MNAAEVGTSFLYFAREHCRLFLTSHASSTLLVILNLLKMAGGSHINDSR